MKLEEQVCSLELSKKLKELGVKQESLFWWVYVNHGDYWELDAGHHDYHHFPLNDTTDCAAFTVAELGESMNIELTDANESESFTLKISNAIDFWCVTFGNDDHDITPQFERPKLADALGEMLAYLIEDKLITV